MLLRRMHLFGFGSKSWRARFRILVDATSLCCQRIRILWMNFRLCVWRGQLRKRSYLFFRSSLKELAALRSTPWRFYTKGLASWVLLYRSSAIRPKLACSSWLRLSQLLVS
uniref:Uncharacterized protein n=1 Tax=Arundo donax TaxID=35708 RepID=A0A0A9DAI4_ARUDO